MSGQSAFTNLESYWRDDFAPLQDAGKAVLAALREDENAPDADLYRRIGASGNGSHQYFSTKETLICTTSTNPNSPNLTTPTARESTPWENQIPPPTIMLVHDRDVPLPPYIQQVLQSVKSITLMGLLPEAELAWLTVDDKLFLWPYTSSDNRDGPPFCSFTVPNGQCVLSVGLVYPNRSVFKPFVHWCLVVTTAEEVILCALANMNGGQQAQNVNSIDNSTAIPHRMGPLKLVPTRYIVPTDGVRMLSVCGTSDGRIFLGGEDGCLYEITYDSPMPHASARAVKSVDETLDQFYNGDKATPATIKEENENGYTDWVVSGGKRVLSAVLSGPTSHDHRPQKCRKLNHTNTISSSLAGAVLPEFLLKATSFILGAGKSTTGGGSIVKIVADEERNCLYTLGAFGWICAFNLLTRTTESNAKLAAVMNTPETARLYLDAVARSRMTPPHSHSSSIGNITFPGDGSAARKGVGGMDGARSILSLSKTSDIKENILTPISLHVVPRKEDGRATLVAVTRGGLRYYISSLSAKTLTSGPPRSSESKELLAPSGGKLSLLHIRAPPPLNEEGRTQDIPTSMESDDGIPVGGFVPRISSNKVPKVNASFYEMGATVLAVEHTSSQTRAAQEDSIGDHVIAMAPDFVIRKGAKAPGGISETLSLPFGPGSSIDMAHKVLSGGIVWDIHSTSTPESDVLKLTLNSLTPTDTELSVGLVPEFVPLASAKLRNNRGTGERALSTGSGSLFSTALTVTFNLIPNLLLSRPLISGIQIQRPRSGGTHRSPNLLTRYRISNRPGTTGFSLSAADVPANKKGSSMTPTSPRLNPRLLRPSVAPLSLMATQHLLPSSRIVAMNSGGLHYFQFKTVLETFRQALTRAGENVERDEIVSSFFSSYGHAEGCAMCILLSIRHPDLRNSAMRAAIARAYRPSLSPWVQGGDGLVTDSMSGSDPLLPAGYVFRASALLDGLTKIASRLTRPIWNKPLVVVTEGRTLLQRWKSNTRVTAAKVELLLDDQTLKELLDWLIPLTKLMKDWFPEVIEAVPGAARKQSDLMDIDEDGGPQLTITDALTRQSHLRFSSGADAGAGQLAPSEAERIARLTEERKIHSLYRLLTRSTQLLNLFSKLLRAHKMLGLPEVEWGSLHGLTVAQLVQTREGQARLEKILNSLVASTTDWNRGHSPSEADFLANEFSEKCYLFFSPGAHFTYLGFNSASQALASPKGSAQRTSDTSNAAFYFRKAASYWHNSSLVTGRPLHTKEKEDYVKAAVAALESGSPLAKAVSVLDELGDAECVVQMCLITAANFSSAPARITTEEEYGAKSSLPWERQLYHKRQEPEDLTKSTNGGGSSFGTVTAKDAILTCWALIFCYLQRLLRQQEWPQERQDERQRKADTMINSCARQTDKSFLHAFFQFMKDSGNSGKLLDINNPVLEDWLSNDPELLHSYLTKQEKYSTAGDKSLARAKDNTVDLPVKDRVACLTSALSSYALAVEQLWRKSGGMITEEVNSAYQSWKEARDLLDIAKLQGRVYERLAYSDCDRLKELGMKLMEVTELFLLCSDAAGLTELCLLILHSCRSDQTDLIEDYWRIYFGESIFPVETANPSVYAFLRQYLEGIPHDPNELEQIITLVSDASSSGKLFEDGKWHYNLGMKVANLGKQVYPSNTKKDESPFKFSMAEFEYDTQNYVFPIKFILAELERLRKELVRAAPPEAVLPGVDWSLSTLVNAGVPYDKVFEEYELFAEDEGRGTLMAPNGTQRFGNLPGIISFLDGWVTMALTPDDEDQPHHPRAELLRAINSNRLKEKITSWKREMEHANDLEGLRNTLSTLELKIEEIRRRV